MDLDVQYKTSSGKPKSLPTFLFVLREFGEVVGDKELPQIDRYDYDNFVKRLQARKKHDGTNICATSINDYTRSLKASFKRAVDREYLVKNPFRGTKQLPEYKKKVVIFEQEEMQNLLNFFAVIGLLP